MRRFWLFHQLKPHRYGLWAKTSKAEYSTCMGFTGVLWFLAKLAIFCVIDNIFSQYLLFGAVRIIGERRYTPIVIPIYVVVQIPLHCFIKCPIPYVQEPGLTWKSLSKGKAGWATLSWARALKRASLLLIAEKKFSWNSTNIFHFSNQRHWYHGFNHKVSSKLAAD